MKLKDLIEKIKQLPPEQRVKALQQLKEFLKKREERSKQQNAATTGMIEEAEVEREAIHQFMEQQKATKLEDLFKEEEPEQENLEERTHQEEVREEVNRFAQRSTEENYQRASALNQVADRTYSQEKELYEITAAEELKRSRGYQDTEASKAQFEAIEERAGNVKKYAQSLADNMREQEQGYIRQDNTRSYN
ncbi:hypothetical protein CMO91_03520 [Candidatus Woesearchaeota archaeon]|nr:hypothetical protein [Candidatus Woesearchaeota archaeon]